MGEREDHIIGLPNGVKSDSMGSGDFAEYWNRYRRKRRGRVPAELHFWAVETYQELMNLEDPSTGRRYSKTDLTQEQIHPRRGRPPKQRPQI